MRAVSAYAQYADFLQVLCETEVTGDTSTFNREAKSAYVAKNYDVAAAVRAGLAATAEARARQTAITLVASIKVRQSRLDGA